jgi:hypothetical protein
MLLLPGQASGDAVGLPGRRLSPRKVDPVLVLRTDLTKCLRMDKMSHQNILQDNE